MRLVTPCIKSPRDKGNLARYALLSRTVGERREERGYMILYLYLILHSSTAMHIALILIAMRARPFDCLHSPEAAIDYNIHVSKMYYRCCVGLYLVPASHSRLLCQHTWTHIFGNAMLFHENVVQFCRLRKSNVLRKIFYIYSEVLRS